MKRSILNFYKRHQSEIEIVSLTKSLCAFFSRHTVAKLTKILEILLANKKEVTIDTYKLEYYADKYLIEINFSDEVKNYADTKITLYKFDGDEYSFKNVCYMDLSKHQLEIFNKIKG